MSRDPHLWATVTLKPAQSGSFFVFNISVNAIACEVSHPMMPTFTTSSPHVTAAVSATAHIIVFIIVGCSFRELEPAEGFEPPTSGLQNRCATTTLYRPKRKTGRLYHIPEGVSRRENALGGRD